MLKLHCTFRVVTHDHEVAWPRPIELSLPTRLEVTNYALGRSFWDDSGESEPCGGRPRGHVPRLCLVFGWPMRLLGQEDLFSNWASCIKHVRIVSEGPVRKKVLLPEKVSLKSLEKVSVGPRIAQSSLLVARASKTRFRLGTPGFRAKKSTSPVACILLIWCSWGIFSPPSTFRSAIGLDLPIFLSSGVPRVTAL